MVQDLLLDRQGGNPQIHLLGLKYLQKKKQKHKIIHTCKKKKNILTSDNTHFIIPIIKFIVELIEYM